MKKVLHVLASNKFSGAENVVCTIIENFKNNYDMYYCSPYGQIEETLNRRKIKYYGLKKLNIKELKKVIKQINPDIIHAHDYTASVLSTMIGFKGRIISHIHINAPFTHNWNAKSVLYCLTTSKYYKIVGVSDSVLNESIFKKRIKDKFVKIYNYIDKDIILKKASETKQTKEYDVFYIGRLNEFKNPIEFIEIISELKNDKIKAVMIGDGELKEKCLNLIKEKNLSNNIDMIGFTENPYAIIKQCKIGIMPSKVEGFGLTAIESSILEKPILNTGVGGLKEIFKTRKELIYKTREDCISKTKKLLTQKNIKPVDISSFCDKNIWKQNIEKLYK